jgi:hypothetical protein
MGGNAKIVFTPYVLISVEDGMVRDVEIDWSDSCMGVDSQGFDPENPDEATACEYINDSQRQERVLNAIATN